MVLKIALDLDQQRQARQQRSDRMAVDILDVHLFEPTTPSRGLGFGRHREVFHEAHRNGSRNGDYQI
jgi:hypothetical protein